jgi:methyl-accepting chemotaxis protein
MATFEEIKAKIDELNATASANAVSVAEVNTRLDGVNTKIDEMRAVITQGGVITLAQLDELGNGVDTAIATLAGISQGLTEISADITDAEQS